MNSEQTSSTAKLGWSEGFGEWVWVGRGDLPLPVPLLVPPLLSPPEVSPGGGEELKRGPGAGRGRSLEKRSRVCRLRDKGHGTQPAPSMSA